MEPLYKEGYIYRPRRFRKTWRQDFMQLQENGLYLYKIHKRTGQPKQCVCHFVLEDLLYLQPLASSTLHGHPPAASPTKSAAATALAQLKAPIEREEHRLEVDDRLPLWTKAQAACLRDASHPYVFAVTFAVGEDRNRGETLLISLETIEEHWDWVALLQRSWAPTLPLSTAPHLFLPQEQLTQQLDLSTKAAPHVCTVELFPKVGIRIHQSPGFVPAPLLKAILEWPKLTMDLSATEIERKHTLRGWYAHVPMARPHVISVMHRFGWRMTHAFGGMSIGLDTTHVKATQILVFHRDHPHQRQ